MDGPKFGRAGARKQAARIGGWRPKNWKSGDQSRCRERPEFGNDPELEQCGPKIGKARQPAASGGSRRLEKSVFKYHKYCVEDGLSVDTPECRSGVSFLPAPADLPSHWLPRRPLLPVGLSGAPPRRRRPAASRGHRFRLVAPPVAAASAGCCAGRSFPSASREFLSADADPPPPGAAGLDWLPRRPLLPVGLSEAPPRRRRPAASRGCRSRLVAPPSGRSFPPDSREFLSADTDPSPPGATGFDRLLRRSLLPAGHSH